MGAGTLSAAQVVKACCQCRPGRTCRLCQLHADPGPLGESYRANWGRLWQLDVTILMPGEPLPPACGVVVGTYFHAALAELQIRLIRYTCGPVPILICDDCSPATEQIEATCRELGADFWRPARRGGHVPGDLAAFGQGLLWAQERALEVLCKLSQRWICVERNWLQTSARALLEDGATIGSREELTHPFPIRTEAVLLRVDAWHGRAAELLARPADRAPNAESVLNRVRRGDRMYAWPLLSDRRTSRTPGVLWHSDSTEQDYRQLAGFFGIDLGRGFNCGSSDRLPDYRVVA